MTDWNDRLGNGLSAEDEAFLNELDSERGLFERLGDSFQGPMKRWTIFANIAAVVLTFIGLWAIWQLFHANTTRGLVLWAVAVWAAWTMQIALKQWLWDRINMLGILRELKRVELRVARIEERR